MKNGEMIDQVRRRGPVTLPVLAGDDVVHVVVDKPSLVETLTKMGPEAECVWEIGDKDANGVRGIDLA